MAYRHTRGETIMSYSPGDWVELVRDVDGGSTGQRGRVTSTGFLGGLDITLTTGGRLTGVDPTAVRAAPAMSAPRDAGCAVVSLVGLAYAVATAWARLRWGL
jgi:hypothetical protein